MFLRPHVLLGGLLLAAAACSGPDQPGTSTSAEMRGAPPTPTTEAFTQVLPPGHPNGSTCAAPASWFPHAQTPAPDNDATFTSNCQFHQWSYQSFLWLTQRMPDGQLRFETFARPSALLVPPGATPPPYAQAADAGLQLQPRHGKSKDPTLLNEINQAGSLGVMVDQQQRAVYYSQYVDSTFYAFVVENDLYDPQALYDAPATMNFPVGALELKAAWKIVAAGERTAGMYTRTAEVAVLKEEDGSVVVDPEATRTETVALVGLHIAGVVKNHPEFIWATFEHQTNAPTLTNEQLAAYLDAGNSAINNQPVSAQGYLFYGAGTTFIRSNQNNADDLAVVNAQAQTLSPVVDVFIQYAQGGGANTNRSDVVLLNESVREQLRDPVFRRFYLGGAIWLAANNGLKPNETQQNLITGSTALSNSVIETFTQQVLDERNCFSCHNTLQRFPEQVGVDVKPLPGKNLNVSHILVNHYFQASQLAQQAERE